MPSGQPIGFLQLVSDWVADSHVLPLTRLWCFRKQHAFVVGIAEAHFHLPLHFVTSTIMSANEEGTTGVIAPRFSA